MQITELAARIESLGLSDKEARVYVANLFLGASPVQKIAEQAGINRATTYVILGQLSELGLVSQSHEGKKTVYVADGPEALVRLFDLQQDVIEERRKELRGLLPQLKEMERAETASAPVIRFYQGPEAINAVRAYHQRKADPKTEVYSLSNTDEIVKAFPGVLQQNPTQRLRKKISSRLIYSYSKGKVETDPKLLRQTQKVGEPVAADINLYEDSATFTTYGGADSVAVVIESPEIVAALRQLFELAWERNQD